LNKNEKIIEDFYNQIFEISDYLRKNISREEICSNVKYETVRHVNHKKRKKFYGVKMSFLDGGIYIDTHHSLRSIIFSISPITRKTGESCIIVAEISENDDIHGLFTQEHELQYSIFKDDFLGISIFITFAMWFNKYMNEFDIENFINSDEFKFKAKLRCILNNEEYIEILQKIAI
jgi:hypothetical protein